MLKCSQSCLLIALVFVLTGCGSGEAPAPDPENPTLETVADSSDFHPGLIDSFRDKKTGELYLRLTPDQLDKDYLYFATFLDGNTATGTQRGIFASQRVIRLHQHYKTLQFLQLNTGFYFRPDSALARSADANVPPAVLATADIVDEADDGTLLVKAGPVFLGESLNQIKPAADPEAAPGDRFTLGELSATRTSIESVRAFPRNLDIAVSYVFEHPAPLVAGSRSVVDARFVSVRMQHTLIEAPDGSFRSRLEDPRVGYFTDKITDMTSVSPTPWRDPISRWKLEKKQPGTALSEPVEPILFWLENTTPEAYRDVVTDAVLVWNEAFETAGFKNAIEVRVQPDDADWVAEDLRYNVLRWTSSSESGWGGYGPSWSDPRTGQILGADVMLEFSWITTFLERDVIFSEALLPGASVDGLAGGWPGSQSTARNGRYCAAGDHKKTQLLLGRALLEGGPGQAMEVELVRQSIYDLVTHEVGHVLGLNHNFRASQLQSTEALLQPDAMGPDADVAASVMDYPAVNYAALGTRAPRYFQLHPGPYDHWAIEFGYSEALADPAAEQARLEAILSRSTEHALGFGLDADVMAGSSSGIDPRVMMFDLASDPINYAARRVTLVENVAAGLLERYAREGDSWQALYNAFLGLTSEQSRQFAVASRWIGGIYVDRAVQGQPGASQPLQPVELARQQQAMALLRDKLFAPDALQYAPALYRHLQQQRRGNEHWSQPQDPKLHARALGIQRRVLEHLLHPVVMERISDSSLYGNRYSLTDMVADLTAAIFAADMATAVNTQRQQLQREYVEQLLVVADPLQGSEHDYLSRSVALYNLKQLEAELSARVKQGKVADPATRAHRVALLHRIETGLQAD